MLAVCQYFFFAEITIEKLIFFIYFIHDCESKETPKLNDFTFSVINYIVFNSEFLAI